MRQSSHDLDLEKRLCSDPRRGRAAVLDRHVSIVLDVEGEMDGGHAAASSSRVTRHPFNSTGTELSGLDGILRYLGAFDLLDERPRFGGRLRIELFGETLAEFLVRSSRRLDPRVGRAA
jgi:hypothetical protein